MAKAKFYNKGIARGKVTKSDIVNYENKRTKEKGHFLSMEVDSLNGNRVKVTMFPTKTEPNKDKEIKEMFSVGSIVEVTGRVSENEFSTKNGQKGIDRSISANKIETYVKDNKYSITFIIQGIVEQIRQITSGALIKIKYDESYTDENGNIVEREPSYFNIQATEDLILESGLEKGCNAKFKGLILNQVELDEYGDVLGRSQMFKVEKIENIVLADDLFDDDLEESPFN